jgi:hypothetical protein
LAIKINSVGQKHARLRATNPNPENERTNDMAYGNVYVFNLYSIGVTSFNINQIGSAGTIGAPSKTSATPYSPPQLVVARTNLTPDQLDNPLFCVGPNSVSINYGGEKWTGTVTIPAPPSPPLQADLWLYLAFGQMYLFDTSGAMIPQPSGSGGAMLMKSGGGGGAAQLTKQKGGASKVGSSKTASGKAGSSKKSASKKSSSKKSSGKRY